MPEVPSHHARCNFNWQVYHGTLSAFRGIRANFLPTLQHSVVIRSKHAFYHLTFPELMPLALDGRTLAAGVGLTRGRHEVWGPIVVLPRPVQRTGYIYPDTVARASCRWEHFPYLGICFCHSWL